MRSIPKQPKILLIIALVVIVVLTGVGFLIVYAINKAKQVTPSELQDESCCSCIWELEGLSSGDDPIVLAKMSGTTTGTSCNFRHTLPIGNTTPTSCEDIAVEDIFDAIPDGYRAGDLATAVQSQDICTGGCIAHSSDPVLFSTDTSGNLVDSDVTFTSQFEYRYSTSLDDILSEAEMVIEYPASTESPDPVSAARFELIDRMDNAGGTGLHLLLYEANFETTWNEVLNSGADGTYTVTFRAKSADGSWIGGAAGTREFVIRSTAKEGEYCYRLDLAPLNGSSPLDVSLSAEAGLPADPETVSYEWNLDLNCDGTVDGGSGSSSEVFTTPADSSEITRTFTIDPDEGESASCAASVSVIVNDETLDELSDGSCTGTVHVSQTTDTCGNGSCETNETCDPDGNISCPANTALPAGTTCSDACFYCGDGYLNTGEQCDPGIPSDESGYEENCQEDCTISSGSPSPGDDSSPAGDEGDATATGTFVITQDIPKCLEMVAPHNTVPITVTITNNDTTGTTVRAISDSLPRGLTYTAGSSSINSAQNTQDNGVLVETTGSSQLVTWDNAGQGWTIVSGGTLTLSFTATVGSSATVGTQTNTITVTPADENPVPSESPVLIAQTCTQPLTGIFDRNVLYILTGLLFLLIAGTAYYTGFGTTEVAHLLDRSTTAWKNTYLHMTQPQKYMEEQVKNSALKKIHQHTDAKTKRPRQR